MKNHSSRYMKSALDRAVGEAPNQGVGSSADCAPQPRDVKRIFDFQDNMKYPYRYAWRNNETRDLFYDRHCRIVTRGKKNTVLLEFADNHECLVTSGNAIRKRNKR